MVADIRTVAVVTQRSVLLAMLKEAGPKGVSGHDLVYRHGITRAAAIVFDLRKEGFDIETVDGKHLADGRQELASYRLAVPTRTLPPSQNVQRALFDDIPAPATALALPCGCVRSANGREWEVRCERHR